MATDTKIQWCDHTFNPYRGCTKISPGCTNCYAETMSHRNPAILGVWGDKGTRSIAAESYWHQPFLWDKKARLAGERRRVFCLSLGDIFEDRPELVEPRARIWSTIRQTPNLDWLLLTKRPQNTVRMLPDDWGDGYPTVWLGVSVEDQKRADERIPHLLQVPAAVRFVSYEPALGPVDWRQIVTKAHWERNLNAIDGSCMVMTPDGGGGVECGACLDWIIVGGESGHRARPFDVAWARSTIAQCKGSSCSVFIKQLGSNCQGYWLDPNAPGDGICYHSPDDGWNLGDKKGGDISKWPHDLRIREFPQPLKVST